MGSDADVLKATAVILKVGFQLARVSVRDAC